LSLDDVFEGIVNPPGYLFEKKRLEKKVQRGRKKKER
jgi:hypothetical protein